MAHVDPLGSAAPTSSSPLTNWLDAEASTVTDPAPESGVAAQR